MTIALIRESKQATGLLLMGADVGFTGGFPIVTGAGVGSTGAFVGFTGAGACEEEHQST